MPSVWALTLADRPLALPQVADVVAFCQDSTTNDEPEGRGSGGGGGQQDKETRQLPN